MVTMSPDVCRSIEAFSRTGRSLKRRGIHSMTKEICSDRGHERKPWHENASTKCIKLVDKDKETPAGVFNQQVQCGCPAFK